MNKIVKFTLSGMALALLAVAIPVVAHAKNQKKPVELGKIPAASPRPHWMKNAVIYEANLRQGTPTRDFKGLQFQLPRLKDLGVDIVWLMPIHPISEKDRKGTLGSYYAVKDYMDVNPDFGTMQDLKELVSTAHNLGMKVILDEVCNHTGCDNIWVTEHPEFYARNEKGEMYGPYDWTDTYKLDYNNPATREAMADALKFWLTEADIDGYRCDVAGEVPTDFWEWVRPQLEEIKPVFMLAEASKPDLLLKAFDADYAWPMKDLFNAIAATEGANQYASEHKQNLGRRSAADIKRLLDSQAKEYPAGAVHMNMVTNHDLNSWEGTEFERYGAGLGAFAVLSYTLPGMPMLYTGQEVGFNHPFEFFEIDSIQPSATPNEMTTFYEMLNALKHTNKALNAADGDVEISFLPTENEKIVAFERVNGEDRVVVVANLSSESSDLLFKNDAPVVENLTDYFASKPAYFPSSLSPWQFLVFTTAK